MEIDSETKNSLGKAWDCILKQYRSKIVEDSQAHGPGMCIFVMKKEVPGVPFNCQYAYIEKDGIMWKRYLEYSSDGETIGKNYDPNTTYLVSVHVPDVKDSTRTIGNIRGFLYDTHTEVEF